MGSFRAKQSDDQQLPRTLEGFTRSLREMSAQLAGFVSSSVASATYALIGHKHSASDITTAGTTGAGFTVGGDLAVNGRVSGTGAVFPSGVQSTGVYTNQLTSGAKVVSIDVNGNLGFSPSPRAVKTNIRAWAPDVTALWKITPSLYQYIAEVQERERRAALPADDPDHDDDYQVGTMLGVIADDLADLGLTEFVFYDLDGALAGVHYELLALALFPIVNDLDARLRKLEQS